MNIATEAPGLVGEIAKYINSSLEYNHPGVALAAAMSFVAVLKSQRFCYGNLAPSIYCCVVGSSGIGKSQAQQALENILEACGIQKVIMGRPASDAAILKALSENPRRFLIWDEFGHALSELSNSKASYRALILATLMELFSANGKVYRGKEYATQERVDLKEPYLSVFGVSTYNRFFGALNDDFIEDGFLPRWLIFWEGKNIERNPSVRGPVPQSIIDQVKIIEQGEPDETAGNLKRVMQPKKVSIDIEDTYSLEKWRCDIEQKMIELPERQSVFYRRAYELTLKLCIVFASGKTCKPHESKYAIEVVEYLLYMAISMVEGSIGGKSEKFRTKDKFRDLIKKDEGMVSLSALTRRAYRLNLSRTERNHLIEDLVESGWWTKHVVATDSSQKKTTFYSRTPDV